MSKRSTYEIQQNILLAVRDTGFSMAELERKVNTGFRTIKDNCETLEEMGFLSIKEIDHHPSNGRPATEVHITKLGSDYIHRMQKKKK